MIHNIFRHLPLSPPLSAQVAVLFSVWSSPSLAVDPLTVRKSRPAAHPQFRQVAVEETLRELPNVLDRGLQKLSTSLPAAVSAELVRAAALAWAEQLETNVVSVAGPDPNLMIKSVLTGLVRPPADCV